jgi:hypothetical protein
MTATIREWMKFEIHGEKSSIRRYPQNGTPRVVDCSSDLAAFFSCLGSALWVLVGFVAKKLAHTCVAHTIQNI